VFLPSLGLQSKEGQRSALESDKFKFYYLIMVWKQFKTACKLQICSSNIRSLLENCGDIWICWHRCPVTPGDSVDRKLDLLVGELARYKIPVAGIQETKWFGSDFWLATNGYMLLHFGRPTPNIETGEIIRGKGVGIVMNKRAIAAWRAAGEEWSAVSSRLVKARLKWTQGRTKVPFLTSICAYAPTAKAPTSVKSRFAVHKLVIMHLLINYVRCLE